MERINKIVQLLKEVNEEMNLDKFKSVKIEIDCCGNNVKIKPTPSFEKKD